MFLRTIKVAKSIPTTEVHAMYDHIFAKMQTSVVEVSVSAYDALEAALAPRPGLLRIVVIDECPLSIRTAFFNMLPTDFDEELLDATRAQMPADGDWLELLKERIAGVENAWKQPVRLAAYQHWIDKNESHIVVASVDALNLQKHLNRADTNMFVVIVHCREEAVSSGWRSSKFIYSMGKACAIPADIVYKKYPSATDGIAASRAPPLAPPLNIGERYIQILVVDDGDQTRDVFIPFVSTIPRGVVLPPFEPGWLSKFKEITRS
ncbi:hypothetical protein FIBSPDRAFT_1047597 [Athelia psychrophila]|uniref:Uncharacterized protein n=1 Tax=Athelia psychrophila TaxID=1759441 RepID=A0A166F2Q0_9AGAM|nr:hypothetical protein FIBSPDRAFT_1047597 [Fibularhizoctonia sp. CBS 109695]